MHLFTFIQFLTLAGLWAIKSSPASLIFPLMVNYQIINLHLISSPSQVLALVGFRKGMDYFPRLFSQKDLFWLDNLMPESKKKDKKKKKGKKSKENGTTDELAGLKNGVV